MEDNVRCFTEMRDSRLILGDSATGRLHKSFPYPGEVMSAVPNLGTFSLPLAYDTSGSGPNDPPVSYSLQTRPFPLRGSRNMS